MAYKLSNKQKCFCDEYLIDLNQTQAAIRAGYSPACACQTGSENMSNPYIRAYIDKALAERSKRTGINADTVIRELARIGLINIPDAINFEDASINSDAKRDDTAAIASLKVKITPTPAGNIIEREVKTYDKTKALELLGKHLGMFTDKVELSGGLDIQFVDDLKKED